MPSGTGTGAASPPECVRDFAPAKINLTLHVTGRRADGYHLLDGIVVFAGIGDTLRVARAGADRLRVSGPRAEGVPTGGDNIVARAVGAFGPGMPVAVDLVKRLPAAAGIGGGSADAAACLRALAALTGRALPAADAVLALGADLPVCLAGRPARMEGIGERLTPLPPLPRAFLVLVNPGLPVPTAAAFAALSRRDHAPMPAAVPRWPDARAMAVWLAAQRNDLEGPARRIAPSIGDALAALAARDGCLLSRMSGSGATCFGLFASEAAAAAAAAAIAAAAPGWWVAAAPMLR